MTRLAAIADKLAIVRSIRHDQGNHGAGNHYMMTGAPPRIPVGCGAFVSFHPSLGLGRRPRAWGVTGGLPSYFSIPQMSRSGGPNFLGAKYAPFVVPDNPNRDGLPRPRRRPPRGVNRGPVRRPPRPPRRVDRLRRITEAAAADPVMALDEYYEQGYDLIGSTEAQAAFDIGREPDAVRDDVRPHARSASAACWPAAWSRPASRSSRSTKGAGTTTSASSTTLRPSGCPPSSAPSRP